MSVVAARARCAAIDSVRIGGATLRRCCVSTRRRCGFGACGVGRGARDHPLLLLGQ